DSTVDAHRDIDSLNLELTFVDLALIERRLQRIDQEMKSMKAAERQGIEAHRELLARLQAHLESAEGLRSMALTEGETKARRAYPFVALRPGLLPGSIGEGAVSRATAIEEECRARDGADRVAVAAMCAKIEAELAQMEPADAADFRAD